MNTVKIIKIASTLNYFCETITTELANYNGKIVLGNKPKGEYRQKTTDVDSFPPNNFGLYDMHGNVWEWCQDIWHENYNDAPTDGSAWETAGASNIRIMRGGSWLTKNPRLCRSANRDQDADSFCNYVIGFRLAMG